MSSSGIRWEDPPAKANYDWQAIVHALRCRPGQWAHVATYKDSVVSGQIARQLRIGRLHAAKPPGSVEATAAKVDGEYRVYARYIGDGGLQ